VQTPAFFSYMSALVIKRARWLTTNIEDCFFGTCWAHAARIFRMIPQGLMIKYLPVSLLRNRSGNDSFRDRGVVHRFSIAIDGYLELMHRIFGEQSIETRHITRVLKVEFPMKIFLAMKLEIESKTDRKKFFGLFKKLYSDSPVKIHLMLILLSLPNSLITLLRILYAKTRPLRKFVVKKA
jgi:abequosyltransferase